MLSRVAENLYWISRYVERAEGLARLLADAFSTELEAGARLDGCGPIDNILQILGARAAYEAAHPLGEKSPATADARDAIHRFLTFDRGSGVSIHETLARARENARGTQEAISGEAWSQLNKLHLYLASDRAAARFDASPVRYLERLRRECYLFAALVDGTMPRTEAYHFLQVGRHLERVDMLSRIINAHCPQTAPAESGAAAESEPSSSPAHWVSLLRGTSAYEAYLQQARERIEPVAVVRYLLLEKEFPRSMRFAVTRCLESLRCIAGSAGAGTNAERHLGRLDSDLRYMDVEDLFRRGADRFLAEVQGTCAAVARDVHAEYFRT
ncbi:MAG TPA: alpha-E domain-containing protein [Gemmata sp.]|nr:alpha-E domain-containing protein [Gemmata sp.]